MQTTQSQLEALIAHYKKSIVSYLVDGDIYGTAATDYARCCELGFILKNIFGMTESEEKQIINEAREAAKQA